MKKRAYRSSPYKYRKRFNRYSNRHKKINRLSGRRGGIKL